MTSSSADMSSILEDLAAGRIDAAEAARRIDAISSARTEQSGEAGSTASHSVGSAEFSPSPGPTGPTGPPEPADRPEPADSGVSLDSSDDQPSADAWAASTDRPQRATHTTESVREPASTKREAASGAGRTKPQVRVHSTNGVERISVRAIGRRVRIVGEPSVATVSADGPHVLRRNGSVLEISSDGELGASVDGYQILRGAPRSLEDFRSLGLGKELFLRVNPAIPLDIEVTAGSLHTERVPRLGNVRVTAGGAKLTDVTQLKDALVQAGQATISGTITSGRSRVRAESGSVTIQLSDDSDVTVTSEAQLGKVTWGGRHSGSGDEVVMGDGTGTLVVELLMAHASVRVGSEQAAGAGK